MRRNDKTNGRMKDDAELVAQAIQGGPDEFSPIVEKYQDAVFAVALSRMRRFHDAQDVAQTVFVEAFTQLGRLRDPARLGGKCGVCGFRAVCGGCRARAYALTGDYLAPEPFCIHEPPRPSGSP